MSGNAEVSGDAWVFGAVILRKGESESSDDFVSVGPQGRRRSFLTYHIPSGTVCTGCFCGTIEEFKVQVKETRGGTEYEAQYERVCEVLKLYKK